MLRTREQMIVKWESTAKELDLYRTFSGRQGQQLCTAVINQRSKLSKEFYERYGIEIFEA